MSAPRADRSGWWLLLTPLCPLLVFVPGGKWLLPWVAPLTLYPAFVGAVRGERYGQAWSLGLLWAALLSAGVITLTQLAPNAAAAGILHGEPYRQEMFGWITTGSGRETTPAAFLPEHALHLGLFVVLTWVSAGYLGLVLGAALVAYMSYFVGAYAAAALAPWSGAVVAWVPWSVARVAAFVLLGVILARPLLVRRPWPFGRRELRLTAVALAGITTDVTVKILAAPGYGRFLRDFGGSAFGSP